MIVLDTWSLVSAFMVPLFAFITQNKSFVFIHQHAGCLYANEPTLIVNQSGFP